MTAGDRIIEAIINLEHTCRRETGDTLPEVWVSPRVYDSISLSIMDKVSWLFDAEDPRGKWANGIITINTPSGQTKVRRAS